MTRETHKLTSNIANSNIQRAKNPASGTVTELEGVILGIIWSRQPCSPYVVLSRFQRSPTWGWSSSTGAIYPAIRRLKARGLLDYRAGATGKRRSEMLTLSTDGAAVLRDWIANLSEEMGSAGIDPIRTRVNYLASLPAEDRTKFLDRAEEVTRSRLSLSRSSHGDPEAKHSWTMEATARGLTLQLEARLCWLKELRKLVQLQGEQPEP